MKTTAFVTHPDCSLHDTGWAHPEHQGRLPAVARAVYRDMLTLFEPLLEVEGAPASPEDLLLAHSPEYVERVRARSEESATAGETLVLEGETRVSGASWAAARAAVGCALTAVEVVLLGEVRNAFCAVRPPGHGAGRASSHSFALFNPVAIAALALRARHGIERVLVVDLGASPGVGTREILAEEPGVSLVALDESTLPPAADGAAVLAALDGALDALATRPDFVLLSLGCDALASDPRGSLSLLPADYHSLTTRLRERAEEWCDGRLVSLLEEGYDPAGMGAAVVQHLRALARL